MGKTTTFSGEIRGHSIPPVPSCAVAIVGMAGRFPGSPDVKAFWDALCNGVECIRTFEHSELEDGFDALVRKRKDYVPSRSMIDGVDRFDAAFFGIGANDAKLIDPQHRIFLECCWEALEDAGYDPATYPGSIGVYAGCSINTYFLNNVLSDRGRVAAFTTDYPVGSYPELLGAAQDFLATRVSYRLNLRGPAMTMQAGCSTSLLTVTQACQTLMLGQADMMLAGGVSVSFPQKRGYLYQEGGMVSPDGHCRTFDARANGTVFGDGAGVVLLKRLEDALADGDSVYAVIRGFAMNNDGSKKIGYTAPSVEGQVAALRAAHRMAEFAPETVGYVECHGTATPLGDPIEVEAVKLVLGQRRGGATCVLGSVKPNVGHLDIAAGVTGLIKAALVVRSGIIPPTLHFERLNPQIDLEGTDLVVSGSARAWPLPGAVRRAGVSAFGVGGSNAHVAIESFSREARPTYDASGIPQLLLLSARSPEALARAEVRLARALGTLADRDLADVAYTLQIGRRAFPYRRAIVASSIADAVEQLGDSTPDVSAAPRRPPDIAFMFPGQGSQHIGMGRGLYESVPQFRAAIDRCAEIALPLIGRDLRAIVYAADDVAGDRALRATEIAQPALFAIEYALASVLIAWGIEPTSMAGHSVGEFVAASLSGVASLEEALTLVCARGKLMAALPGGAMLAVRLAESKLAAYLGDGVDLAAVNAPELCVLAGPIDAIEHVRLRLEKDGVTARVLHTSHAFHSAMMDGAVAPLESFASDIPFAAPRIPYVSGVTGTWIDAESATRAAYWARHCRETVRFADALRTLVATNDGPLVEIGPGSTLATFAVQGAAKGRNPVLRSLPTSQRERPDLTVLLETVGRLWTLGARPNWEVIRGDGARLRVSLPAYSFDRTRHWVDAPATSTPLEMKTEASKESENRTLPDVQNEAQVVRDGATVIERLRADLVDVLETLSGENVAEANPSTSFLELGFDSLFLGRFVQTLQARFGVSVSFRQLLGELPSIAALAAHLEPLVPAEYRATTVTQTVCAAPDTLAVASPRVTPDGSSLEAIMREQMQTMERLFRDQLDILQRSDRSALPSTALVRTAVAPPFVEPDSVRDTAQPSRFDAFRITGNGSHGELSALARKHVAEIVRRTIARTPKSKAATQRYRGVLADPRVAAGFRAEWKEMVYPITCVRAHGSRLWDIDGNEYIDILNGFGQTAFGHAPEFVVDAVRAQLDVGFAIGPQADLAGEAAELFCELTGNERMTFCNTGSEAVMAALRVARTVTGRDRVVMFGGAYHGQFDEVLAKGSRTTERSIPVAPGIPANSVSNITVLPYATDEALTWVRAHANELAAVVVEPVQSRHPALQPQAFLTELREITAASGSALIFDEVVTGFRVHPGGMQAIFGIRADLATYGKVLGGGMPIGILAGNARFMDALDGGTWSYGDDSQPEVAPTFFAGTFVRHPLTLAAVVAVLKHLQMQGPELQRRLTDLTSGLVARLNAVLQRCGISSRIETFGSMFYFNFTAEESLASLLYYHLRERGVYVQEGFPCFLTTTHTNDDVDRIVHAFASSIDELQTAGIFGTKAVPRALTEEQQEIWLAAQAGDDVTCAFNESITLRLSGELRLPAFEAAWRAVVERHDALRLVFAATGESMRATAGANVAYAYDDLSNSNSNLNSGSGDAEAELRSVIETDSTTPFDLVGGPAVRARLLKLSDATHAFIVTAHHIVCDGWSINLIVNEFATMYGASIDDRPPALVKAMGYLEYADEQQRRDPNKCAAIERFWLEQFADPTENVNLPTDHPRPQKKTYRGHTTSVTVDRERYRTLKRASGKNGVTLFVTLLAAYQILLARLARTGEIVVGIPAAGQAAYEGVSLVGHCVNFLPIRSRRLVGTATLSEIMRDVRDRVLDAYEHQAYTFGTLVRTLDPERTIGRVPLTEFQFNLERLEDEFAFGDVVATLEPNPKAFVHFDLFLNAIESDEGLRLVVDYNAVLFDESTVQHWLALYVHLLDCIVVDGDVPIDRVVLPTSGSEDKAFAVGPVIEFEDVSLHGLIEARVALHPDARAAVFDGEVVTYRELDERANRLARYFRSIGKPGLGRVGICLPRSLDMLVALLAALKAGYSYVPLDPTHPVARLAGIVAEAELALMIVGSTVEPGVVTSGVPVVRMVVDADRIDAQSAEALAIAVLGNEPAYLIHTSGSTGKPKGVEIPHRAVVNFMHSVATEPGLTSTDVLVAVTTVSFDIAALELFLPLVVGGTVVIASSERVVDGALLRELVEREGATALQATPATWRLLIEAGFSAPAGFKMLCGGEALPQNVADTLLQSAGELWNMYGPTETTIWSSCARVLPGGGISVGKPLANTQCYVLDESDRIVIGDIVGHLHIGGAGVALGYPYLPELTHDRFVANPWHEGRMYRTGDAARIRRDGSIELLGRLDDQIKLNGYRIELGEIETALVRGGSLVAAAVVLHGAQTELPRLVAYVVPRSGETVDRESLEEHLRTILPGYMIPRDYVTLDALPLNTSGKVDRRALPEPPRASRVAITEPLTVLERQLLAIFIDVLDYADLGTTTDVLALGADSIQVFKIVARANKIGIKLLAKDIFRKRTVQQVAKSIGEVRVAAGQRLSKLPPTRLIPARERQVRS